MVGWMPCFSQISLIGTCSKRCSRRIFAFSSGLYRLRCLLLMLLFLGSWKSSLFQTPKEDISTEAEQDNGRIVTTQVKQPAILSQLHPFRFNHLFSRW